MIALRSAIRRMTPALVVVASAASVGCEARQVGWGREPVPEPTVFAPGIISTAAREYGIAFTPDGADAYFTRRARRGPPQIFVSRYTGGSWSEPAPAAFSTGREEAPFITPDGDRMLFSSGRPVWGSGDRSENIWVMERGPEGWMSPTPLPGVVNQPRSEIDGFTTGSELGPILAPNGSLLYWTRVDSEWGSDLYVADPDSSGAYVNARPLLINTYGDESNPAMSPDGRYLIFQGYRNADAFGGQDLYASEQTDYGWSDPWLLPKPINSEQNDSYPSFSPDGRFFFFASDRGGRSGYYDIYYVEYDALRLLQPQLRP